MAEVSSLTGLSVESSILCANFMFATLFALAVFGLTRIFIRKPEFVILACLFAVLGPRFVDTSFWNGSARGVFAVLVTLVVFISFRASVTGQRRLLIISLLLAIGCFLAHHMAVLLVVFALGYVMAVLLGSFLPKKVPHYKRGAVTASVLLAILFIGLLALWHFQYFEFLGFYDLQKSGLFDLDPPGLSIVANMALSYTNQIGFILVLAFLGVPYVLRRSGVRTESLYLLTLPIAFVPLLGSSLYVSMLLTPFVAILGTLWLARLTKSSRFKFAALPVIAILLVSSVALPILSTERWNEEQYLSEDTVEVDNQVFNDAIYLGVGYERASFISNANVMMTEIAAISDSTFLGSWIFMTLTGDIKYEDIKNNVTWSQARFPRNLYIWFAYQPDPNVDVRIFWLMCLGVVYSSPQNYSQGNEYFSDHQKIVVVVDNLWPLKYVSSYAIYPSTFMTEIQHSESKSMLEIQHSASVRHQEFSSYKSYESEGVTLYIVQLPV
jgi:sorbitol-specific phosphotransferase system component IIC